MNDESKLKPTVQSGDTCNGVPKPTDPGDWICDNGKWVKIDVPSPEEE